jgi:hypothetical protein
MFIALVSMLIRLALTCFTLAMRVTLTVAALIGRLLGYLLLGIWRSWKNRQGGKVPLRAEQIDINTPQPPALLPPSPNVTSFTPRPLRPRPKR